MPIYEFYCESCHALFSFLSPTMTLELAPSCPRCGRKDLPKRPSTFATLKHASDEEPSPFDGLDDSRMEGAMDTLMREMGDLDDDADSAQVGRFFRRFSELSGLEMGPRMQEALSRLEAGEDLEQLESEFEDLDDEGAMDDLFRLKKAANARRSVRPEVDPELYFL
jgi:putative FmdB family regulatory protein